MPGQHDRDMRPDMQALAKMKHAMDTDSPVFETMQKEPEKQIPEQWENSDETRYQIDMDRARALMILTYCIGMLTQTETEEEAPSRVFLSNAPGASVGRKGGVRLFPDYDDSPVGIDRGGSASYDIEEIVIWIGKKFPDVLEKLEAGLTDEDDAEPAET